MTAPSPAASFADVLNLVHQHFTTYVMTCSPGDLDILTLWAAHTHLCEQTYTSPRLLLDSPVPGSGKTTVLEHLERLCFNPVQMSSVSSPALLVRILDAGIRTILIDEVDRSLSANKAGIEDIIAVLNSGYKVGASRPVLVSDKEGGWIPKEMPTFSPVVMAGNSPNLPDDTRSRCIEVLLMPAAHEDVSETDWEEIDEQSRELGKALADAAATVRDTVRSTKPEVDKGCIGRMKERWLPLKRVAAAASPEWASLVDDLIREDIEKEESAREEGLTRQPVHVTLLHHINEVWPAGEKFLPTTDLVAMLIAHDPKVWGEMSNFGKDLTMQRMGRMLAGRYKIRSDRPGGVGRRGYSRSDFNGAFRAMRIASSDGSTGTTGFAGGGGEAGIQSVPHPSFEPVVPVGAVEPARNLGEVIAERRNAEAGVWLRSGEPINVQ